MAKHHPDLIMCRKQPGICAQAAPSNALAKCMCRRRPLLTRPCLAPCSGWPPVRKVRRQVPRLRLLRAAVRPRAYLRRVQLRLLSGSLCHLWPAGHLRCLLLQGVHAAGEGRTWRPAPTPAPARTRPRTPRLPCSRIVCERASVSVRPQRDGCPKIVNLGSSKTDLFYERKKYGFRKR